MRYVSDVLAWIQCRFRRRLNHHAVCEADGLRLPLLLSLFLCVEGCKETKSRRRCSADLGDLREPLFVVSPSIGSFPSDRDCVFQYEVAELDERFLTGQGPSRSEELAQIDICRLDFVESRPRTKDLTPFEHEFLAIITKAVDFFQRTVQSFQSNINRSLIAASFVFSVFQILPHSYKKRHPEVEGDHSPETPRD